VLEAPDAHLPARVTLSLGDHETSLERFVGRVKRR